LEGRSHFSHGLHGFAEFAEEGIAMAGEMLEGFTAEEEAYFYELSKEKYELDMQEYETEAWKKGIAEGLERGRTEGLERGRTEGLEQGRTEGLVAGKAEGLAAGKVEGIAEGLERGRTEKEREVLRQDLEAAKKMRDRGFSPDEIRDLLPRLTMEDILNI
jgi:flagellar biosynthesis/type III secretory pathway protein FliH